MLAPDFVEPDRSTVNRLRNRSLEKKEGDTMGVEEDGSRLSAQEVQWSLIDSITRRHVPFPDEPFHPRNITVRVRTLLRLPSLRPAVTLNPIAFVPRVNVIDVMGCVSMMGGMSAYLYLDPDRRLVRKIKAKRGGYYAYVADPLSITREDIEHLEIGVQGDNDLLDAEYNKACDAIMTKLGYAN